MRIRRDKDSPESEMEAGAEPALQPPGPIDVHEALSGVTKQIEEITASAERGGVGDPGRGRGRR